MRIVLSPPIAAAAASTGGSRKTLGERNSNPHQSGTYSSFKPASSSFQCFWSSEFKILRDSSVEARLGAGRSLREKNKRFHNWRASRRYLAIPFGNPQPRLIGPISTALAFPRRSARSDNSLQSTKAFAGGRLWPEKSRSPPASG